MTTENPNPPCPRCGSSESLEIVHDQSAAPELALTKSWVLYEGICDIHPDRWVCGECNLRWYPRKIVERDLDLLTWQLQNQKDEEIRQAMQERLAVLRTLITILANADNAKNSA